MTAARLRALRGHRGMFSHPCCLWGRLWAQRWVRRRQPHGGESGAVASPGVGQPPAGDKVQQGRLYLDLVCGVPGHPVLGAMDGDTAAPWGANGEGRPAVPAQLQGQTVLCPHQHSLPCFPEGCTGVGVGWEPPGAPRSFTVCSQCLRVQWAEPHPQGPWGCVHLQYLF